MPDGPATSAQAIGEWQLTAVGGLGQLALAALALGVIFGVIWTWRSLDPRLGRRRRVGITALRAVALGVALGIVLQPTLRFRRLNPLPSRIAVLVDVSGSMTRGANGSRLDEVEELLEREADAFDLLARQHHLSWYRFADGLDPLAGPEQLSPFSEPPAGTRIRRALEQLCAIEHQEPLTGVLLISDGADTEWGAPPSGEPSFDWARELPAPVNTVLVQRQGRTVDLSIASAKVDPFAFSRSEMPIAVTVRSIGLDQQQVELTLWREGSLMQRHQVSLVGGEGRTTFTARPSRLGRQVLTVSVPTPEGDEIPENNVAHLSFEVIRDKFRVLHIAGHPSWDQRFLRDALSAWPRVDLVSFYILRTPYQSSTLGASGLALIPFPTDDLFERHLDEFDIVILQDFDPSAVGVDRHLPRIAEFVHAGGGLVLIGGEQGYGAGAISIKPFAELLPIELLPPETPRERLVDTTPFRLRLTEAGTRHPLMRLVADARVNAERWQALPRLDGVVRAAGIAANGVVLAEHPKLRADDGPAPVIAAREVAKGRVLAVTTDALWRWRYSGPMAGGPVDIYPEFWRRAVSWLTREPELDRLRIKVAPSPVEPGQAIGIDVELVDASYQPVPGAELAGAIAWLDERGVEQREQFPIRLDDQGRFRREWEPLHHGPHHVQVDGPGELSATDRFLVLTGEAELAHLDPNSRLLERLAEQTGGRHTEGRLDAGGLALATTPRSEVLSRVDRPIWDHPLTLLLLLALLIGEWLLRRRSGLA